MRILALVVVALFLTGCMPAEPVVTPVPSPSTTPLFASDAEALAAATAAYAAYLAMSDQILSDGGREPERILAVATAKVGKVEMAEFATFQRNGFHASGITTFNRVKLEFYDPHASKGESIVRLYLCVDVSQTDVVNTSGASVIPSARQKVIPFEIGFDSKQGNGVIVVASTETWSGANFCA